MTHYASRHEVILTTSPTRSRENPPKRKDSSHPHFSILKLSVLYLKRNSSQPHFSILKLSQLSRTISKNGVIVLADNEMEGIVLADNEMAGIVLADNEMGQITK